MRMKRGPTPSAHARQMPGQLAPVKAASRRSRARRARALTGVGWSISALPGGNAEASVANLAGTTNPVQVSLSIGDDAGLATVHAKFDRRLEIDGN
jgi:hypothetical protein